LVNCIAGDVNQVMLNLIINAADAISERVKNGESERGLITVCTRREGDSVEIRVSDTGSGIPEAVQSKIFDPFFTTKGVGKGTGQGLAIAHAIVVQKHQGTIQFETKSGVGTTFVIRLPIGEDRTPSERAETSCVA
jgi:signal transduction histidine kinase